MVEQLEHLNGRITDLEFKPRRPNYTQHLRMYSSYVAWCHVTEMGPGNSLYLST